MKNHIGISLRDYDRDRRGRVSRSPMYHHPDFCPYYGPSEIGDCVEHCRSLRAPERPCNANRVLAGAEDAQ